MARRVAQVCWDVLLVLLVLMVAFYTMAFVASSASMFCVTG